MAAPLSPRAEQKEDGEHSANHLQIYVSRTFIKAKKSVICTEYPISSKFFHLTYFSQFIDKFLKTEENVTSLIFCKFPLFSKNFLMLVLGLYIISQFTQMENWDFECCSRLDFPIFPMMKEMKTHGVF